MLKTVTFLLNIILSLLFWVRVNIHTSRKVLLRSDGDPAKTGCSRGTQYNKNNVCKSPKKSTTVKMTDFLLS